MNGMKMKVYTCVHLYRPLEVTLRDLGEGRIAIRIGSDHVTLFLRDADHIREFCDIITTQLAALDASVAASKPGPAPEVVGMNQEAL